MFHDDNNYEPRTEREILAWCDEVDTLAMLCEREEHRMVVRNDIRAELVA